MLWESVYICILCQSDNESILEHLEYVEVYILYIYI